MKLKVFIPSYNRAETIKTHRLFSNTDLYDMFVVVHEDEHKAEYLAKNPDLKPEQILVSHAKDGICGQRLFIECMVEDGEWYISADDDISSFMNVKSPYDNLPEITDELCTRELYSQECSMEDVYKEIQYMIAKCEQDKCELFGFAVTDNHFFRKKKYTEGGFIIGQIFVEKRDWRKPTNPDIKLKEDYARTAKHLLYSGTTLRNNFIRPVTKMYSAGGVGSLKDRTEALKIASKQLVEEYEGLFRMNTNRANEGEILINIRGKENIQKWRLKMILKDKLGSSKAVDILGQEKAELFWKKYNL